MSQSSAVVAGTNATAQQYNDLRTDATQVKRRFIFEVLGALVVGNAVASLPIPANMTVTKIKCRVTTGSATVRVQGNGADVLAGISVSTSYTDNTSITSPSIAVNTDLTVDVTAISSSPANLYLVVEATETI